MIVPEHTLYYLEIITPEVEKTCRHYAKTCGWSFRPAAPELGNARVAELEDGSLCGVRAPMSEEEKPMTRTYLRVDDLDQAVKNAAGSGASILLDKMELPGHGIIAIYEIGGVEQGLWQVD